MRTIGLIGGMSWESSVEYYRIINATVMKERLGGLHSARSIMYSVDFADIEVLQHEGRWHEAADMLVDAAQRVERGGADVVLLCTNTMHKVADAIQQHISVPLLHIADATARQVQAHALHTVGLLGTRFTMEEPFYKTRLSDRYDLRVLVPSAEEREIIHRVIYDELCIGVVCEPSKAAYLEIIDTLVQRGAQGIILGCTEIGLLIKPEDCPVPVFDTTHIHAVAAVDAALEASEPA
jgi:aspartate racemase